MDTIEILSDKGYTVIPIDRVTDLYFKGENEAIYSLPLDVDDEVEKLKRILAICFSSENTFSPEELYSEKYVNKHIDYLANYLKYYDDSGFNVQTIVIEHKYVSLSFLKDFSNYYSLGYNNVSRYCRRFHFFEKDFDTEAFDEFLITPVEGFETKEKNLLNYYLGHVVIKPLNNSLIGATLIRSYKEYFEHKERLKDEGKVHHNAKRREFNGLRKYNINLFGKPFTIETLVFQEQDRAISACATVALWMTFHKIAHVFRTQLPAPSEITSSAGLNESSGRAVPTSGLQLGQIIRAIDNLNSNIVSEIFTPTNLEKVAIGRSILEKKIIKPWKIKRYIYAYLKLEIPPLLGYNIIRLNGNHLVTITGYRKEKEKDEVKNSFPPKEESAIHTEADRIQRLFSHDDQLGPYSKVGFNDDGFSNYIRVNWRGENNFNLAIPQLVAVPITDFIRIKFNIIESFAESMQLVLEEITNEVLDDLIWDIYITKSNSYKTEFSNIPLDDDLNRIVKLNFLKVSFPQYIWVAKLSRINDDYEGDLDKTTKLVDFIFDATDTPKSMNLFEIYYHSRKFRESLKGLFSDETIKAEVFEKYSKHFKKLNFLNKIEQSLSRNFS